MRRPAAPHGICWITDYFAAECHERACIHSPNPLHPCVIRDEAAKDVA